MSEIKVNGGVIDIRGLIIDFGDECWICGIKENITKHHAIPKCFNPIRNLKVPLCKTCHKEVHRFMNKKLSKLEITEEVKYEG